MAKTAPKYGELWTREESVLAFDLYCRIPFQQTKASNPEVQRLAAYLGRSAGSVARKLGNFGAFDPELRGRNIVGLSHTSALDKQIWNEFHSDWGGLVAEADRIRRKFPPEESMDEFIIEPRGPSERISTRRQRLHQTFFRQAILSSYQATCCITGINVPECLIAAHIVPWGVSEQLRADPTNGLCLSATFDRLFDAGLVTISIDYVVLIAGSLRSRGPGPTRETIASMHGRPINRPQRFMPSKDHLKWHLANIFKG